MKFPPLQPQIFLIIIVLFSFYSCNQLNEPIELEMLKTRSLIYSDFKGVLKYDLDTKKLDTLVKHGDTVYFEQNSGFSPYPNEYIRFARWSYDGNCIAFIESFRSDEEHISIKHKDSIKSSAFYSTLAGYVVNLNWHPLGNKIIYSRPESKGGKNYVYLLNLNDRSSTKLTPDREYSICPDFTADGNQIIFSSKDTVGILQLFKMNANGSNIEQLTNGDKDITLQDCATNADKVIYLQKDGNNDSELFLMDLNTKEVNKITDNTIYELDAKWSNDDKFLLYVRYKHGLVMPVLVMANADGTNEQIMIDSTEIYSADLLIKTVGD